MKGAADRIGARRDPVSDRLAACGRLYALGNRALNDIDRCEARLSVVPQPLQAFVGRPVMLDRSIPDARKGGPT
jgi:hypothetical protein